MDFHSRRAKAAALTEIFVHLCMPKRDNLIAVSLDLIGSSRQILFNFKCKPFDNGFQQLLMFLRLLGVQKVLQKVLPFSVCIQVILNAISLCPNDLIIV